MFVVFKLIESKHHSDHHNNNSSNNNDNNNNNKKDNNGNNTFNTYVQHMFFNDTGSRLKIQNPTCTESENLHDNI